MSKEISSNVIVAKIFASFIASIHVAVIFVAITLLYTARREDSAVARLLASLGLDFWDFFKIVLAILILYVIFVGAVVTLIAINENLMSIREDIADGDAIRRQDIDSLQEEMIRIRRVMEGESPDNLECEAPPLKSDNNDEVEESYDGDTLFIIIAGTGLVAFVVWVIVTIN